MLQNAFILIFFIICNVSTIFKFHYNNSVPTFRILIQLYSHSSSCKHSGHWQTRSQVPPLDPPQERQTPATCQAPFTRLTQHYTENLPEAKETKSSFSLAHLWHWTFWALTCFSVNSTASVPPKAWAPAGRFGLVSADEPHEGELVHYVKSKMNNEILKRSRRAQFVPAAFSKNYSNFITGELLHCTGIQKRWGKWKQK